MKYVSEIVVVDGKAVDSCILQAYDSTMAVRVYDTRQRTTEEIDIWSIKKPDFLGLSHEVVSDKLSVVRHTDKTARLHDFVKRYETVLGTREVHIERGDYCVLSYQHYDRSRVVGSNVIALHLVRDFVGIGGMHGSVASRQFGMFGEVRVSTLYDLLVSLCKECKVNFFTYDEIQLFSKRQNFTSTIKLDHSSVEAKRYFAKASLDIGRL